MDGRWPAEWLRGVLELCVLAVVADGPTYGYAIAQRLEAAGLGTVKGGTLYPLLARLERDGLVSGNWHAGDGGPGRKYVELTSAGAKELITRSKQWSAFSVTTQALVPVVDAAATWKEQDEKATAG